MSLLTHSSVFLHLSENFYLLTTVELTISITSPTNQEEFDAFRNSSAAVIQSWIDSSSPPGVVQHVGTAEVVQDYEMIRRALKYDKIHFLGDS